MKPVLERWIAEAEERYKNGIQNLSDFVWNPWKNTSAELPSPPKRWKYWMNTLKEIHSQQVGTEMQYLVVDGEFSMLSLYLIVL